MSLLSFLGIQTALLVVLAGLGLLIVPVLRKRDGLFLLSPWVGLSLLLAGLPLLHLWRAMDGIAAGILVALACVGWALGWREAFQQRRRVGAGMGVFLVACLILGWPLSMMPSLHYDWGLYYQQVQKWSSTCSVVPGLGNLHSRFAFPGTSFLAAGLLDSLLGEHWWGARILGGFVLGLGITSIVLLLVGAINKSDRFLQGMLFILPVFLIVFLERAYIAVAAPDLLSAFLLVLWAGIVFKLLEGKEDQKGLMLPLATALVLLKLSNLVLVVCVLSLLVWKVRWRPGWKEAALWIVLVIGWMAHNWVQSAWPLYPFGISLGNPDWAMNAERVKGVGDAIRGWARLPGPHYLESLQGRPWLESWLRWELSSRTVHILGGVSLLAFVVALVRRIRGLSLGLPASVPWMLSACFVSLIAWFLSAPDERFAIGVLWILGGIAAGCLFQMIESRWIRNTMALLVALSLLPALIRIATLPISPMQPRTELQQIVLPSGLVVWAPAGKGDDQVWNAPLPATPELTDIESRGSSLCDGFRERKAR